jgi:predicted N-acetyltransferase YhbS
MTAISFTLAPCANGHHDSIEHLLDICFGLGRRAKTSYRLREGEQPVEGLSFLARADQVELAGVISYWRVFIGERAVPALLLGPLAVHPNLQGQGIGRALMRHTLGIAKARGERLVILIGDEPYYSRVGFRKVPDGRMIMPGYVDPDRFLYLELVEGALDGATGLVLSPSRLKQREEARSVPPASPALAVPHQAQKREQQRQRNQRAEQRESLDLLDPIAVIGLEAKPA